MPPAPSTVKNSFLPHELLLALHHFHAEKGNYGIATGIADRLIGTSYDAADAMPRSATVNNLGYTDEVARRYPWVAMLDRDLKRP